MKKIRVCYLSASAGNWGGASRVFFNNLKQLDKEKFEPWVLLPCEGPILEDLRKWGVAYRVWGKMTEPGNYFRYFKNLFSFAYFLKRNRLEILHSNHPYWRPAEILAAKLVRVPVITHYHVVMEEAGPFVRLSNLIIANSKYTARASKPDQVPKKVIYNPVELERFDQGRSIRGELGIGEDEIVISFIGQIKKIKGMDLFIQLARELSVRRSKLTFLIAGKCREDPGAYTEQELFAEMGETPNIHYLGRREDVENIYHTSDILVMPSRWDEPFGLVNIEAGACRKPIVSTRVGGIPEIIDDGVNGFLVERDDLAGLLNRVMRLIDNPDLRRQMGQKGREKVERRYAVQPIKDLEQTYMEILGN